MRLSREKNAPVRDARNARLNGINQSINWPYIICRCNLIFFCRIGVGFDIERARILQYID